MINRRRVDLIAVMLLALLAALAAWTKMGGSALQAVLGSLLVLFLPGYALTAATFGQNSQRALSTDVPPVPRLDGTTRIALSVGMSMGLAVLGAFVLNWTPWGLQPATWAVLLAGITLAASLVALLRDQESTFHVSRFTFHHILTLKTLGQSLYLGLAVLIALAAVAVARVGETRAQGTGFTELWMLAANEADQNAVRVGINNNELQDVRYRLQVQDGGYVINTAGKLSPGEKWSTVLRLPASQASAAPVEARLYREEVPNTVYRRVVLWPQNYRPPANELLSAGYSELWMLPANDGVDSAVRVGIINREQSTMKYRLLVQMGTYPIANLEDKLEPGATWETTLTLPANTAGKAVEAVLYRAEDPNTVYRRIVLNR